MVGHRLVWAAYEVQMPGKIKGKFKRNLKLQRRYSTIPLLGHLIRLDGLFNELKFI
jgi:hypothetical protein